MFKIDIDCLKTCHQKMYIYILLVDYHDEAGTYLQLIKAESRCNEQKQRDQMQLYLEKSLEKRKWIHHTPCQPIIPVNGLWYKVGYSIHQFNKKFFHLPQNVYHATQKKQNLAEI